MSDHSVRPHHGRRESGEQSILTKQDAWMARWSRTPKQASLAQNNLAVDRMPMKGNSVPVFKQHIPGLHEPSEATDASNCISKDFTEVPIPDKSTPVASDFLRKKKVEHGLHSSMLGLSENHRDVLDVKDDRVSFFSAEGLGAQFGSIVGLTASAKGLIKQENMSLLPPPRYDTQSREHLFSLGGTYRDFVEKRNLLPSSYFKEDFLASSSKRTMEPSVGMAERVDGSRSFLNAKGQMLDTSFAKLEPADHCHDSSSAVFVHEQGNDPLTSKNQLALFLGDNEYQKSLNERLRGRLLHSRTGPSQPRDPFFDTEPMRMSITTDSMEFTENKTDANLFTGEGDTIRDSTLSTSIQLQGSANTFTEVLDLPKNGWFKNNQRGVKLQPLWSSTDSEEKENAIYLKNESSAETNTMDMDTSKEGNHSDMYLRSHHHGIRRYCESVEVSLSNKDYKGFTRLFASRSAGRITSEGWNGRESNDTSRSLPNHLECAPATSVSKDDDKEQSMSKTQSLDAALLLPDADVATNSKSRSTRSGQDSPDPGIRWVKRLKVKKTESFSFLGTKTSKMESTPSPKKFNPLLRKSMKRAMTSPELLTSNEPLMAKDGRSSSMSESVGKGRDELLLHSWIRRWCCKHSQAKQQQKKKPAEEGEDAAFVFCGPESLKVSLDEIRKKQFPSIAAMALMGKAMNGFQPCEFRNRGGFVVWNTK